MSNDSANFDNGQLKIADASAGYPSSADTVPVVPPGYKLTEVGVIPDDWEVLPLSECLIDHPKYGINAPAVPYSDRLPLYLRITDITDDGRFSPEKLVSVDNAESSKYYLNDGDIVFARTGASVGKSYCYKTSDGPLVFAGFLIRVRPDQSKLLPYFLAAYITTGTYWNWVRLMSMRSGQPGINGNEYAQLPIPIPNITEQRAIAAALSDVDALIAKLDQIIAKKRNIKQAAMQVLLTGQIRLPMTMRNGELKMDNEGNPVRFSDKWEEKRLGELGSFLKGRGISREQAQSGEIPCVRYGEIYTTHDNYIRTYHSKISREIATTSTRLMYGDILFAGSGETKEEIGKCVAYVDNIDAYAGGDIVILRPRDVDPMFFGYALNTRYVTRQKASLGQGDAVVHISARALADLTLEIPKKIEQTAIAKVLSDMDAEIAAFETRREKTQLIKQGMMQELLTGRIRLA